MARDCNGVKLLKGDLVTYTKHAEDGTYVIKDIFGGSVALNGFKNLIVSDDLELVARETGIKAFDRDNNPITVGCRVERLNNALLEKGSVFTVIAIGGTDSIRLNNKCDFTYDPSNFRVVCANQAMPEKVRDPHPHAEVAKAWLDGYPVEVWSGAAWLPYGRGNNQCYVPSFNPKKEFRIQPVETEKEKKIKELVSKAEELLAKAKELEATK